MSHSGCGSTFRFFIAGALLVSCQMAFAAAPPSARTAPPPPSSPTSPPPLPAAFKEAAALREGRRFAEASVLLEGALSSSEGETSDALSFALAETLRLQDDPGGAAALLATLAEGASPLASYASFALARCHSDAGKARESLAALTPCLAEKTPSVLREAALRLSLEPPLRDHAPQAAINACDALEKLRPDLQAQWRFQKGEALLSAKKLPEAKLLLAKLWKEETGSPWGHRAGLLFKRRFPETKLVPSEAAQALLLARAFLSGGRTQDAWEVIQSLEGRRLPAPSQENAEQLRAAALYALRWNADLQAYADTLRAKGTGTAAAQFADLKALWACLRDDDPVRAEALAARLLASPLAKPATTAEVRFALGTLYFCQGEWKKAAENLDAVNLSDGSDTARAAAPYRAAWAVRKGGDNPAALIRMRRVAASAPPAYADPARYIAALWQEEAGEGYLAQAGWESLALGSGYWAAAAREALAARGKGLPARRPTAVVPPPYEAKDPDGRLAEILELSGFPNLAAGAFEPVYEKNRKDPSARFHFAQLLAEGGQVGRAVTMARSDYGDPERLDEIPAELAPLFYPAPCKDRMPALAPPLTPALAWAITKRESGFDATVLSPAGAVGLMQLMPDTAAKLALPGESLPAEEELVDPSTNLRLGTAYLAQLWAVLGKEEAVIAAYNAGEERVGRWLKAFQASDEKEFVAMIPYEETRIYTQRVLFDRRRYTAVAGGDGQRLAWK